MNPNDHLLMISCVLIKLLGLCVGVQYYILLSISLTIPLNVRHICMGSILVLIGGLLTTILMDYTSKVTPAGRSEFRPTNWRAFVLFYHWLVLPTLLQSTALQLEMSDTVILLYGFLLWSIYWAQQK